MSDRPAPRETPEHEPPGDPPAAGTGRSSIPRTAGEMLAMARAFLDRKGVPEARLEAELLVAHALGLKRLGLFLDLGRPVRSREIDLARDLLVRRGKREPLAYITGEREFYGRSFRVGKGVLVPRPETELLVDRARAILAAREASAPPPRVLDFGTGSGCVAVTLALEVEAIRVTAVDVSTEALAFARENAERLGAEVSLLRGDDPRAARADAPYDLIVSNPPYVDPAGRADLAPEVRDHEPADALFVPGDDVDHWVRRLLESSGELLAARGALLVELAYDQGERAVREAERMGFTASLHRDLARIDRVLEARR